MCPGPYYSLGGSWPNSWWLTTQCAQLSGQSCQASRRASYRQSDRKPASGTTTTPGNMANKKASTSSEKQGTKRKSKDELKSVPPSKSSKTCPNAGDTVSRRKDGTLDFPDHPRFRPNRTPEEVLQAGSFGGTYFRPIKSSVTGESYKDVWKELPDDWLQGLDIKRQVASSIYHEGVNKYGKKCGGSLEMWEQSGWIVKQDPYGWFQWYCRFYEGRRTEDDERQIGRWDRCAGQKGRWKNNLIGKVVRSGCKFDNTAVSPVVRQTLLHWGYELTEHDHQHGAKRVKT